MKAHTLTATLLALALVSGGAAAADISSAAKAQDGVYSYQEPWSVVLGAMPVVENDDTDIAGPPPETSDASYSIDYATGQSIAARAQEGFYVDQQLWADALSAMPVVDHDDIDTSLPPPTDLNPPILIEPGAPIGG